MDSHYSVLNNIVFGGRKMSVMKAKEIMEVIPHRQPMLLIDND